MVRGNENNVLIRKPEESGNKKPKLPNNHASPSPHCFMKYKNKPNPRNIQPIMREFTNSDQSFKKYEKADLTTNAAITIK
jgi:hypothetical protein